MGYMCHTCDGRGGAGRGGGCFFCIFGGRAGLGDSGLGGGFVLADRLEPLWPAVVGACNMANGSLPKSSLLDYNKISSNQLDLTAISANKHI